MRPACLRNARSLASARSPLLPFLAPRAFAEAPYLTRQDDCRSQKEQEQKRWNEGGRVVEWGTKGDVNRGTRYADIFSFARQQLRSYSTRTEVGGGRTRWIRRAASKERAESSINVKRKVGRIKGKRAVPRLRIRKTVSVLGKVVPWSAEASQRYTGRTESGRGGSSRQMKQPRRVVISDRRRQRRLNFTRKTIGAFLFHEYSKHRDVPRRMFGKYRSLRRRILALSARESQIINLEKPLEFLKKSRGDYIMMAFAALDRNVYARLNRCSYPIILKHHPMCADWTASLFSTQDTAGADQVWKNWNMFDHGTRENYWPHLLIFLLDKFPHRALPFLQALTHRPCVQSLDVRIIADAFENLGRAYLNKNFRRAAQRAQLQESEPDFVPAFYHVFREHLAPHTRICTQDLLFCVAKLANIEDFRRLFDLLKESDTDIGHHVFLHYVNKFAKAGEYRQALACLKMVADKAENQSIRTHLVNTQRFRWSCALVLHRSMMEKDNYHETTGIVAALLDLGVKLDILLYNVIIRNAMEAGDYSTAFKVYNTLNENGLKPDQITFSTLLHGCTVTSDPAKFNDFAEYCAETAKEMKDPWLAADYLYFQYVRLHRKYREPEEKFGHSDEIIRTYLQFFSPRPLEPFWAADFTFPRPSPLSSEDGVLTESAFMDPPPIALYIMLQLEIFKASSTSSQRLWILYQKFTSLVDTHHDPVLLELARNPLIWNAFLLAFCHAQHFEYASQVVHDISLYGTAPNVYTWNIFMQAFFKTQQIQAAERVYEIMRARGIKPDQFTYEVLLRGYARAQHARKIGEVMTHVETEKQDDPKLLRDLARVHDQRRMLYELEKARVRKEEWERLEKEAKEQRERARWAPPKFAPLLEPKEPVDSKEGPRIKPLFEPGSASGLRFKSMLKK